MFSGFPKGMIHIYFDAGCLVGWLVGWLVSGWLGCRHGILGRYVYHKRAIFVGFLGYFVCLSVCLSGYCPSLSYLSILFFFW